jgi:hypothetical protein
MFVRIFTLLLTLILAGAAPSRAQDQPASPAPSPINTDRPAFTNSSVVVPPGSFQAENGFLATGNFGQTVVDVPETLVRFGLTKRTEFRFTVPDYFDNVTTGAGGGFGDLALGVKQQLGPLHKFDLSLIAFVSIPTGANGVSSGGYDPGLQAPWSRALSANWTAAGMFSVYWPTYQSPEGRARNVTGETTFLFDRQLTKPWDAFVEYAGDFPEVGGTRHVLHFGTAFKVANDQQVDFHVGFGLSAAAVDHIVGVGYSFRFQAIASKE